jgi:mono/diheme cytochrome c family protein
MKTTFQFLAALTLLLGCSLSADESKVDFSRDIRPVLSDNCFLCHGPDESSREADLRLDLRDEAINSGAISITDWQSSEILARITSDDPDLKMPPTGSEKQLAPEQVDNIKAWLADGAPYSGHWAFTPPKRPDVPTTASDSDHPIDAFINAKLSTKQLPTNSSAEATTLLRRIYLDLIGLPPTPKQLDAFASSTSTNAFASEVDQLLESKHFGERWARWWLDAGRYADSDGYEKDKPREVWFYRDWVINSINADMPYDEFIIKQIAGDLLPKATQDDVVATGFLRNSMVNEEGGADPEQFRVEGMFDRMDAIGKSILGITTQCAQCHTHKYDPLTQREYYEMFAALNSFHEAIITVYTPEQKSQIDALKSKITSIEEDFKSNHPQWRDDVEAWRNQQVDKLATWHTVTPTELPFEGQKFKLLPDSSVLSESYAPTQGTVSLPVDVKPDTYKIGKITAMRLDALRHPQLPHDGPGRSIYGTGALTEFQATVQSIEHPDQTTTIKFVRAYSDMTSQPRTLQACFRQKDAANDDRTTGPIEYAIDGNSKTAWTTDNGPATRNEDCHAVFIPETPIEIGSGIKITFGLKMDHGGWNSDDNQNYLIGRYRLSITGDDAEATANIPSTIEPLLAESFTSLSNDKVAAMFSYWRTQSSDLSDMNKSVSELLTKYPEPSSQLAVQERSSSRDSFVMLRGDFLNRGDVVEAKAPSFLNAMSTDQNEPARMRFAKWLVAKDSPTTARVIVNRIWQSYFGRGLVATPEDFGFQSPPPSHPELLDWLAVELMDSGWSLKHIHRLIATSKTYQKSSIATAELLEKDPSNVWLARGPRFRTDAETVRDIALSVSGLLDDTVGGPSVYPPAPAFLFEPPASYGPKIWAFKDDSSQYRRSVYVHRFRSVPLPVLQVFDAPKGDASCVRRERSNTPLQALVMLNETQFMQCAQSFATRVIRESAEDDEQSRLQYAHQLATGRIPSTDEVDVLQTLLVQQRDRIANNELDASALIQVSDSRCKQLTGVSGNELAPWIVVCRAILNLDETITKE